jgi:hypothetical protein
VLVLKTSKLELVARAVQLGFQLSSVSMFIVTESGSAHSMTDVLIEKVSVLSPFPINQIAYLFISDPHTLVLVSVKSGLKLVPFNKIKSLVLICSQA